MNGDGVGELLRTRRSVVLDPVQAEMSAFDQGFPATISVMEPTEPLAQVLKITRVRKRGLSQAERVQALLDSGDPRQVLSDLTGPALLDDPLLVQPRQDINDWVSQSKGIVTVLSDWYLVRLRDGTSSFIAIRAGQGQRRYHRACRGIPDRQ